MQKIKLPKLPKIKLSKKQKRVAKYVGLGLLGLYLFLTVFTWGLYRHKFFPRSVYSGKLVGNSSYSVKSLNQGLPTSIQLVTPTGTLTAVPKDMGLSPNPNLTLNNLKKERQLGPLLAFRLFQKHRYPLGVNIDEKTYTDFLKNSLSKYEKAYQNAHLVVDGDNIKAVAAQTGSVVKYNDFKKILQTQLTSGSPRITVPFETQQAEVQVNSLQGKINSTNAALGQGVKIAYTGGSYSPTKAEKVSWLSPTGNELGFDKEKITNFLAALQIRLGQNWDNNPTVAEQIANKLAGGSAVSVTMHDRPIVTRTYSYCVALKDVDESYRAGFAAKIHSTYTDPRGWGLGGKINFVEASSGCDFTIWLAAANDLPAMGPGVCDNYYSCTVSPNVIINFDRWQGATDPWNAAGGSLDDYHVMVINHETGHWLGFGHRTCPGAGQPAPVMQQQSISLQGCTFNPWPTPVELTALAQLKGV